MSEFFSAFRHFSGILASNIGILAAFKMEFRAIKIGTRSRSQIIFVKTISFNMLRHSRSREGPRVGSAPGVVRYERLKTYILSPTLRSTTASARAQIREWRARADETRPWRTIGCRRHGNTNQYLSRTYPYVLSY